MRRWTQTNPDLRMLGPAPTFTSAAPTGPHAAPRKPQRQSESRPPERTRNRQACVAAAASPFAATSPQPEGSLFSFRPLAFTPRYVLHFSGLVDPPAILPTPAQPRSACQNAAPPRARLVRRPRDRHFSPGARAPGHRRRQGGALPLVSPDGRHALAVNGEIYNHRALRAGLCTCTRSRPSPTAKSSCRCFASTGRISSTT